MADRHERVDVDARGADQIERLPAIRLAEAVEEQILALQRAADRHAQRAAERRGQPDQQRVRQVDDVEAPVRRQPLEQLVDLLALEAVLPASIETVSSPRLFGST